MICQRSPTLVSIVVALEVFELLKSVVFSTWSHVSFVPCITMPTSLCLTTFLFGAIDSGPSMVSIASGLAPGRCLQEVFLFANAVPWLKVFMWVPFIVTCKWTGLLRSKRLTQWSLTCWCGSMCRPTGMPSGDGVPYALLILFRMPLRISDVQLAG